jgi:hypothetical protein
MPVDAWVRPAADDYAASGRRRFPARVRGSLLAMGLVALVTALLVSGAFLLGMPRLGAATEEDLRAGSDQPAATVVDDNSPTAPPSFTPSAPPSPTGSTTVKPTAKPKASTARTNPPSLAATSAPAGPTALTVAPRTSTIVGSSGNCVDDDISLSTEGNPIKVWECNNTRAQLWAYGSDRTLGLLGMCMRPAGAAPTSGTLVQLRACASPYQAWYFRSDQVIVNADSGLCLTDPGILTNGRPQLTVATCTAAANQRWTFT